MVSMVDQHLRNHRNTATETAAVAVFESLIGPDFGGPTILIIQTALHWALELNSNELYHSVWSAAWLCSYDVDTHRKTIPSLPARETVLKEVGRHVEDRFADRSKTIEWETW